MQESIPGTDVSLCTWLVITGGQLVKTQTSEEGHVIGDFSTESLLLCADLAKTILDAAQATLCREFSQMTIVSKMFQSAAGKAGLGVAILSSMPAQEDFRLIAKDILSRVSPKNHHLVPRNGSPAQEYADQFLARHGGKSISTMLVASIGTDKTELCGRLPSQAQRSEIKQEISSVHGKVDGLSKKRRTVFIDVLDGKSISGKFDEGDLFERLVDALRDGKAYRFTISVENNGTDKPEPVLKKFELLHYDLAF